MQSNHWPADICSFVPAPLIHTRLNPNRLPIPITSDKGQAELIIHSPLNLFCLPLYAGMIPVSPNIVCPSHHTNTIPLVAKCLPSRNSCTPPHMSCQLSCLQLNISSFLSSPRQRSRSKAWSVLGKTSNLLISCMLNFSWPCCKKEKESRRARSCKMHTYIYLTLAQRKLRSGIPSAFSSGIWALFSSLFQMLLLRCGSYPLVHLQSEKSSSLASPCFLSQTQPTGYGWVGQNKESHTYDVIVDLSRSAFWAPSWIVHEHYAYFYVFYQLPLPVNLGNENLNSYLTESWNTLNGWVCSCSVR